MIYDISTLDEQQMLYETLLEKNYVSEPNAFIRATMRAMIDQGDSFSFMFMSWRNLSLRYGTTEAVDILLEECMKKLTDKKGTGSENWYVVVVNIIGLFHYCRLSSFISGEILSHCQVFDHPSASLAEMICVAIRIGHFDTAKEILTKVSISATHFRKPLRRWSLDTAYFILAIYMNGSYFLTFTCVKDNLLHVEQLAALMSMCMYGEKRDKRKGAEEINEVRKVEPTLCPHLLATVNRFCGIRKRKPETGHKKGKKIHEDDEALYILSKFIQNVWVEKAVKSKNVKSAELLLEWSSRNNVDVNDGVIRKIEKLKR
uniref:Pentatricopeptide repeat-containing protein n=1 Tax=Heterorhabditis bacteriophora TaxID=37862 RepID=A0A1I7XMZ8_HETBA